MESPSCSPLVAPYGVSVVIPCYNYAQYLSYAVDSALAQDHRPLEVIIVDDGSTDNTPAVVAGYGDRVQCVRKANGGLPAARNTGIRSAIHPFVAFLDADDVWAPGFLPRVMEAFARSSSGYGLVATRGQPIDREGRPIARVRRDQDVHGLLKCRDIILRTRFSPSAVVARRDVFDVCGFFDESLTSSEDRDMWIRIGAQFPMLLLPEALALIRNHPSSMSKNADRMKRNSRRVIGKAFSRGLVPRWRLDFWLRVLSFNWVQCAWMYYDQRRYLKAVADMSASLFAWPWFVQPALLNEPVFFRVRALRRFLWESAHGLARS